MGQRGGEGGSHVLPSAVNTDIDGENITLFNEILTTSNSQGITDTYALISQIISKPLHNKINEEKC